MTAYYNEIDKFAAQWLRNLIAAGHIAPGDVDERDIRDVRPDDIRGYTQCHFFAGIGVWSYTLRRAGWPDDRPAWTGSCPCQPFSSAGRGGGFADERHLWPAFFHLIGECRPAVVFGEQVASKDGLAWIDLVLADLEGENYAGGAFDLCAAGFGAPHIRQRLYWLADANAHGRRANAVAGFYDAKHHAEPRGRAVELANAEDERSPRLDGKQNTRPPLESERPRIAGGLADTHHHGFQGGAVEVLRGTGRREEGDAAGRGGASLAGELGHTDDERSGRHAGSVSGAQGSVGRGLWGVADGVEPASTAGELADTHQGGRREQSTELRAPRSQPDDDADMGGRERHTGPTNGFWRDPDWLFCRDGKWRPVESGAFPLAHGAPARVGRLRAYGNAIVARQAEEFIAAYIGAAEHIRLSEGVFG